MFFLDLFILDCKIIGDQLRVVLLLLFACCFLLMINSIFFSHCCWWFCFLSSKTVCNSCFSSPEIERKSQLLLLVVLFTKREYYIAIYKVKSFFLQYWRIFFLFEKDYRLYQHNQKLLHIAPYLNFSYIHFRVMKINIMLC